MYIYIVHAHSIFLVHDYKLRKRAIWYDISQLIVSIVKFYINSDNCMVEIDYRVGVKSGDQVKWSGPKGCHLFLVVPISWKLVCSRPLKRFELWTHNKKAEVCRIKNMSWYCLFFEVVEFSNDVSNKNSTDLWNDSWLDKVPRLLISEGYPRMNLTFWYMHINY